jgi:hypothetical protein
MFADPTKQGNRDHFYQDHFTVSQHSRVALDTQTRDDPFYLIVA